MDRERISRRQLLAITSVGSFGALAGCLGSTAKIETYGDSANWRFSSHDTGHSGYNPHATGIVSEPTVQYRVSLSDDPDRYSIRTSPTPNIVDDIVYVGGDGFRALDATDGTELWHVDGDTSYHGSATVDSTVYATSRSGDRRDGTSVIHALDATDGTERWNRTVADGPRPGPLPPVVAGSTVYGHAERDTVRAINVENGDVRWTAEEWGASGSPPVVAIDSEQLYHFDSSGITARDPDRSTVRRYLSRLPESQWQEQPPEFFHGWPTTSDGTAYTPGEGTHDLNDGEMSAFASDGSHRWNYEVDARATPPAVANDRLYLARFRAVDQIEDQYQYEPTVVAIDAEDGTERWDQGFEEPRPTDLRPIATDDVVYVCNVGDEVYAFDTDDGTKLWTAAVDGDIGAMATVDESLYVTTTEGTLYSLSA